MVGGAAEGALIGFFIGVVIAALGVGATSEAPPLAALAALMGAGVTGWATAIGAVLGGIAGAILAYSAHCSPCGSCIEIAFHLVLGKMLPVLPFVVLPRTADCTLVPPGCP